MPGKARIAPNPAAFDPLAGTYDADFTDSPLGRRLRARVWAVYSRHFAAGQRLLELACGTGEDAVWLARQGLRVTATDGSAAMVGAARAKVEAAGLGGQVEVRQVALQEIGTGLERPELQLRATPQRRLKPAEASPVHGASLRSPASLGPGTPGGPAASQSPGDLIEAASFDGAYSNFGGLNTLPEWRGLAAGLAHAVRPGGRVVLVVMGPLCPWEIAWHLAHGQAGRALRRLRPGAAATLGGQAIPVWYPSPGRLRRDFDSWFRPLAVESLGLWLPPSYVGPLVSRRPRLLVALDRLDRATAHLAGGWGDHYIISFERRGDGRET